MAYLYPPSGGDGGGNTDVVGIDSEAIATNRKKYLLDLVPGLSLDEIWMLQKRLASLDLRTDIFSRLPPELQMLVADDLGPSDLGCCLQVSSKWRDALLHESMLKKLARRCFPSLLEYIDVVHKNEARTAAVTESSSLDKLVASMFTDAAKKYAMRAQGRFSYVFRHCRDPPARLVSESRVVEATGVNNDRSRKPLGNPLTWLSTERAASDRPKRHAPITVPRYPPLPAPDLLANGEEDIWSSDDGDDSKLETYMGPDYAHGRMAWQCISGAYASFIVDDLRTGKRSVFNVRNSTVRGQSYLLCALGDQLLILSAGTSLYVLPPSHTCLFRRAC